MSHKLLVAAIATVALGTAGAAGAATLVSPANGPDLTEMLHNNFSPDGTTIKMLSQPTGFLVDATSPTTLHANGNGFAMVTGVTDGFGELTLLPDPASSPALIGFSAIKFKLDLPNKDSFGDHLSDLSFDIDLTYLGLGSPSVFHISDGLIPPNDKYEIRAGSTETITSVKFLNLMGDTSSRSGEHLTFDDIKQISFNAVTATVVQHGGVPEPATWGMMLVGFFAAGSMLRRRTHVSADA